MSFLDRWVSVDWVARGLANYQSVQITSLCSTGVVFFSMNPT